MSYSLQQHAALPMPIVHLCRSWCAASQELQPSHLHSSNSIKSQLTAAALLLGQLSVVAAGVLDGRAAPPQTVCLCCRRQLRLLGQEVVPAACKSMLRYALLSICELENKSISRQAQQGPQQQQTPHQRDKCGSAPPLRSRSHCSVSCSCAQQAMSAMVGA